jgi:hypothetical protein
VNEQICRAPMGNEPPEKAAGSNCREAGGFSERLGLPRPGMSRQFRARNSRANLSRLFRARFSLAILSGPAASACYPLHSIASRFFLTMARVLRKLEGGSRSILSLKVPSLAGCAACCAEWLRLSGRILNSISFCRRLRLPVGPGWPGGRRSLNAIKRVGAIGAERQSHSAQQRGVAASLSTSETVRWRRA